MDTDGRHSHRVAKAGGGQYPCGYGQPLLSPDGRKVLVADRGLTVAWLATGVRKHLGPGDESTASWAPDSRRIAFSSLEKGGVFVVDVRSGRRRTLLRAAANWDPAWSPDGKWIAYVHTATETAWVYVIRPTGGRPRFISEYAPLPSDRMRWSAEGKLAFFGSFLDSDEVDLVVSDVDAGRNRVARLPVDGGTPAWSPDGKRIAYVAAVPPDYVPAIFTVRWDGSHRKRLTPKGAAAETDPAWSPDGRSLAFARSDPSRPASDDELGQVWTMRADGSHRRILTRGYPDGGANSLPMWVRGELDSQAPPRPVEHRGDERAVLRVPFPVDGISAEGERVAVAPAAQNFEQLIAPTPPLYVWGPSDGALTRLVDSACNYPNNLVLDRERLALDCDQSGVDVVAQSLRIYDLGTRLPQQVFFGHNGGVAASRSTYLDQIAGDETLLAFGSEQTDVQGVTRSRTVWRIDGSRRVALRSGPHAGVFVSAAAGRLAVELDNGSVAILRANGKTVRVIGLPRPPPKPRSSFEKPTRQFVLAGNELFLLEHRELRVYDVATGALARRRRVPPHASLEAADSGLAVYVAGPSIHLVGRSREVVREARPNDRRLRRIGYDIEKRVHADLTRAGLFYCFNVADRRYPGRVVFVPRSALRAEARR